MFVGISNMPLMLSVFRSGIFLTCQIFLVALALRPSRNSLGFIFQMGKQISMQTSRHEEPVGTSEQRSLQNYVHYLKASYTSVFGDTALTSSLNPHI